jgi:hypothetical protein|nr:MAG TPA: hypothetical protein [Caudoviricetes sp.]
MFKLMNWVRILNNIYIYIMWYWISFINVLYNIFNYRKEII